MVAATAGEAWRETIRRSSATAIRVTHDRFRLRRPGALRCPRRATDAGLWQPFQYARVVVHLRKSCGMRRAMPCDRLTGHRHVAIEIKRGESSTYRELEGRALCRVHAS